MVDARLGLITRPSLEISLGLITRSRLDVRLGVITRSRLDVRLGLITRSRLDVRLGLITRSRLDVRLGLITSLTPSLTYPICTLHIRIVLHVSPQQPYPVCARQQPYAACARQQPYPVCARQQPYAACARQQPYPECSRQCCERSLSSVRSPPPLHNTRLFGGTPNQSRVYVALWPVIVTVPSSNQSSHSFLLTRSRHEGATVAYTLRKKVKDIKYC